MLLGFSSVLPLKSLISPFSVVCRVHDCLQMADVGGWGHGWDWGCCLLLGCDAILYAVWLQIARGCKTQIILRFSLYVRCACMLHSQHHLRFKIRLPSLRSKRASSSVLKICPYQNLSGVWSFRKEDLEICEAVQLITNCLSFSPFGSQAMYNT